MAAKKAKYYDISKVYKKAFDENSNFIFIYGGKSKGKSYQAKKVLMIDYYLKTGKRFCLLRRYDEEINKAKTELYFRDLLANIDLEELTDGEYNNIECISSKVYFTFVDEAGKTRRKEHIGYAISLNREQNFSSILSEKDIDNIIFEEFQSRTTYLTEEADKMDFLYSTIDRERGTTKVWFLGNAISKACPYWEHFGILELVKKQKVGIESHIIEGKKILLEKTPVFNATKTTVGTAANAIAQGDWYYTPQPKIKMKGHVRGLLYVRFNFSGLLFLGELNQTPEGVMYWFIRSVEFFPYKKHQQYLVTNKILNPSRYTGSSIYKIGGERFQEVIKKTFTEDNIYYSTDETGTDFKTACTFRIK